MFWYFKYCFGSMICVLNTSASSWSIWKKKCQTLTSLLFQWLWSCPVDFANIKSNISSLSDLRPKRSHLHLPMNVTMSRESENYIVFCKITIGREDFMFMDSAGYLFSIDVRPGVFDEVINRLALYCKKQVTYKITYQRFSTILTIHEHWPE